MVMRTKYMPLARPAMLIRREAGGGYGADDLAEDVVHLHGGDNQVAVNMDVHILVRGVGVETDGVGEAVCKAGGVVGLLGGLHDV